MSPSEVRAFIVGRAVSAADPATGVHSAIIEYRADGSCEARFAGGGIDAGEYGFVDHFYWTRYESFRGGLENRFALERVGEKTAQAHHDDGRLAFLLSQLGPAGEAP